MTLQTHHFLRVVGQQADPFHSQIRQHLSPKAVVSQVHRKAQLQISFYGVQTLLLQLVGFDLGTQPDASPLLPHVENDPSTFLFDSRHGRVQLGAAVASARAENVSGQAFAVHPNHDPFFAGHFTFHQSQVLGSIHFGGVQVQREITVVGGHTDRFDPVDQFFGIPSKLDQRLDGADLEFVFLCETQQLWQTGH